MTCSKKVAFASAVLGVFLVFSPIQQIKGFSNGAPPSSCVDMIPQHGVDAQFGSSPFLMDLMDGEIVLIDSPIRLELRSQNLQNPFEGFFVMAFDKSDHLANPRPIGRFKQFINDGKVMDCPGGMQNAATHSSNLKKTTVMLEWIPPTNFSGQVVFRTTFVKGKSTFWVKQESKSVSFVTETTKGNSKSPMNAAAPSSKKVWAGLTAASFLAFLLVR